MIADIAVACFAFAGLCGLYRIVRGPLLADRVAALDVALVSLMGSIAAGATASGDTTAFVLLAVLAIIGFTATLAASRFIEVSLGDPMRPRPRIRSTGDGRGTLMPEEDAS